MSTDRRERTASTVKLVHRSTGGLGESIYRIDRSVSTTIWRSGKRSRKEGGKDSMQRALYRSFSTHVSLPFLVLSYYHFPGTSYFFLGTFPL
jgi:hypothetical protein